MNSDGNTEIQDARNWYNASQQSASEAYQGTIQPHGHLPGRFPDSNGVRARREDSSQIDADLIRDTPRIDSRLAAALLDAQNFRAMPIFIPDPSKVLSLEDIISPNDKAVESSVTFLDWFELEKLSSTHEIPRDIPPGAPASGDHIVDNTSCNVQKAPFSDLGSSFHQQDNAIELTATHMDGLRRKHERLDRQAPNLGQASKGQAPAPQRVVGTAKSTLLPLSIQLPSGSTPACIAKGNTNSVSRFLKDGNSVGFVPRCGKVNAKYMLPMVKAPGPFPPPSPRQLAGALFGKSTLAPKIPPLPSQILQSPSKPELWGGESFGVCCSGAVDTGTSTPELTEDDGSSFDEEDEEDY
jgi:hypothetical protein